MKNARELKYRYSRNPDRTLISKLFPDCFDLPAGVSEIVTVVYDQM